MRKHSRSHRAAKIQNIFDMVVTLQPFLVKFTRFLLNNHKTMTMLKNPSTTMRRFFFFGTDGHGIF